MYLLARMSNGSGACHSCLMLEQIQQARYAMLQQQAFECHMQHQAIIQAGPLQDCVQYSLPMPHLTRLFLLGLAEALQVHAARSNVQLCRQSNKIQEHAGTSAALCLLLGCVVPVHESIMELPVNRNCITSEQEPIFCSAWSSSEASTLLMGHIC